MTAYNRKTWYERHYVFLQHRAFNSSRAWSLLDLVDRDTNPVNRLYKGVPHIIGVNPDPLEVLLVDERHVKKLTLVCGDVFDAARRLSDLDVGAIGNLPKIAVYNFDTSLLAGEDAFWAEKGGHLRALISNTVKYNGWCAVFLTFLLDAPPGAASQRALAYSEQLREFFGYFGKCPNFSGADHEGLDAENFVGAWGPHEVYQESRRWITTRLWIREGHIVCKA